MKKLLLMVVAAVMVTVRLSAQEMFIKPMVGGSLSTLVGSLSLTENKMRAGLVAGAEFGYGFSSQMGISVGVLYSMQGCKIEDEFNKDYLKLDYINIPVLFNYDVIPGLAIKAGPQLGYCVKHGPGSEWNNLDFSVPLGLSYEVSNFVIDARYNLGLSNVIQMMGRDGDESLRNSVIQLTLGYMIPF